MISQRTDARILVIIPHPDDEALFIGGTLAKYSQIADVKLLVVTDGAKGKLSASARTDDSARSIEDYDKFLSVDNFVRIRRAESIKSAEVLGVHEVEFLNWPDGIGHRPDLLRSALRRSIRGYDPHVIITLSEAGTTGHSDHSYTAIASYYAAVDLSKESAGSLLRFLTFTLTEAPSRFDYWGEICVGADFHMVVEVADHTEKRVAACLCYKSQSHWVDYLRSVDLLRPTCERFIERWPQTADSSRLAQLFGDSEFGKAGPPMLPMPLSGIGSYTAHGSTSLHLDILKRIRAFEGAAPL
jgi:LmbE family N-acetylglucosaminyl deacetylase